MINLAYLVMHVMLLVYLIIIQINIYCFFCVILIARLALCKNSIFGFICAEISFLEAYDNIMIKIINRV